MQLPYRELKPRVGAADVVAEKFSLWSAGNETPARFFWTHVVLPIIEDVRFPSTLKNLFLHDCIHNRNRNRTIFVFARNAQLERSCSAIKVFQNLCRCRRHSDLTKWLKLLMWIVFVAKAQKERRENFKRFRVDEKVVQLVALKLWTRRNLACAAFAMCLVPVTKFVVMKNRKELQ